MEAAFLNALFHAVLMLFISILQLTPKDTVHELLQFALERPECCYRTSLSVRHKGKRLDDFYEISAIEDLQDWDTLELVEGSTLYRGCHCTGKVIVHIVLSFPFRAVHTT